MGQLCRVFGLALHVVDSFLSDTRHESGMAESTCEHIGGGHRWHPWCSGMVKLNVETATVNFNLENKNGTLKCRFRDSLQINQGIKPTWSLS